jgi:hypothetical protein
MDEISSLSPEDKAASERLADASGFMVKRASLSALILNRVADGRIHAARIKALMG